uniref:E3 ubiquitin-protein ligase n=1 Tax=Globodera pallida TaxID=36090 RepID=A0A183BSI5_GLOPA
MSNQQSAGTKQNPSSDSSESGGRTTTSSGQRKRHSPNQTNSASGGGAQGISNTTDALDSTKESKVRKISTTAQTKASKGNGEDDSGTSAADQSATDQADQQNRTTPATRELQHLIDYFPDAQTTDGNRMTRSRAKAMQEKSSSDQQVGNNGGGNGGANNGGGGAESAAGVLAAATTSKSAGGGYTGRSGVYTPLTHHHAQSTSKKHHHHTTLRPQSSSSAAAEQHRHQHQDGSRTQRAASFLNSIVPRMQHLLNSGGTGGGTTMAMTAPVDINMANAAGLLDHATIPTFHFTHGHGHHHQHVSTTAVLSIVEGLKSSNEIRQSEAATELADILLLGNEDSLPNLPIVEIVQSLCALLQKDHNFDLMLTAARCITNMQEALPRALPVITEAIPLLLQKLKRIEYIDVAEQSLIALEVMSRRNAKNILLAGGLASTISHVDFFSLPSQRLAFSIAANCAIHVTHNEFSLVKDCLPDLTQRLVYVDDKRSLESICILFNRIIENMRQHSDKLRQILGANFEFLINVQKLLAIQPSNISSNTYLALLKSLRYICSQCSEAALALVRMDFGNTIRFLLVGTEKSADSDIASGGGTPRQSSSGTKIGGVDLVLRPPQQLREIISLVGQIVQKLPPDSVEVVSLLHLFPLFVEIGTNSTCAQLRHESLNVMMKMCCAVESVEQLEPILRDIPLAVYIAAMLSSNRNLGVLSSALQLTKVLLEKLPKLYIPLFETEGVFHEIQRLTTPIQSPTIDRKSESRSVAMAEQLLEGLVAGGGGVGAHQATSSSNMRMLIPQMLFNTGGQGTSGASSSSASSNSQSYQEALQQQQALVCNEAKQIVDNFSGEEAIRKYEITELIKYQKGYDKLCMLSTKFEQTGTDAGLEPLKMLKTFLLDSNGIGVPTSFQFNQSGIVPALVKYLTDSTDQLKPTRNIRLQRFSAVFFDIKDTQTNVDSVEADDRSLPFHLLVAKVLSTIATIEQFQVRITNLSGIITSGGAAATALPTYQSALLGAGGPATLISTTLRGAQALRFFQTHQIRCNLRRHPSCKTSREWRHGRGSIKIDPFTSVSAIERYLIERGVGIASNSDAQTHHSDLDDESDDISDEDLSFTSTTPNEGHIELYIGEHRLPPEISVLQAIRQFSLPQDEDTVETIPSSIWLTTHTIYYRSSAAAAAAEPGTGRGAAPPATISSTATVGASMMMYSSSSSSSSSGGAPSTEPAASLASSSSSSSSAQRRRASKLTQQQQHKASSTTATMFRQPERSGGSAGGWAALSSATSVVSLSTSTASASSSTAPASQQQQSHHHDRTSPNVYKSGVVPARPSPLEAYLKRQLSSELKDPCQNCLTLLRVLYGLNTFWWKIFDDADDDNNGADQLFQLPPITHRPIIAQSFFHSSKLNSKVTRQLADFLTVATQQIPKWTLDLVRAVPFIFNFPTRRSFLFCTAFGRDRALMHLVNETGNDEQDGAGHDAASRLITRLERRKVQIKRDNLLRDAQQIFTQLHTSRAMLEVGFHGEVGTGFGPTLEFYSTLSRSLQKSSLRLWDGTVRKYAESDRDGTGDDEYIFAAQGLYPQQLGTKAMTPRQFEQRIKRFEFIGRLLAQTLIDSRMLDLDLAPPVFKWLIGQESTLGSEDFEKLDPIVYRSLRDIVQTEHDQFDELQVFFTYPGDSSLDISRRQSTNGNWLIQTFFGRARRGRSRGLFYMSKFALARKRWNQSAEDEREMNKACFYLDKALKVFHNCFPLMAAKAVKEAALFGHEMGNKKVRNVAATILYTMPLKKEAEAAAEEGEEVQ